LVIALSGLLVIGAEARAQVARQEIYALQSVTLSDFDFLSGKRDGVPVTVAGTLRLPKIGTEKCPPLFYYTASGGVGGSGGMIGRVVEGVETRSALQHSRLIALQAAASSKTVTDQTRLGRLNMIIGCLPLLSISSSRHRQSTLKRIAVMGSHAAPNLSVYSSLIRFQKMHGPQGREFAAILVCIHRAALPITAMTLLRRLFGFCTATADDYVPIGPCRAFVERLSNPD